MKKLTLATVLLWLLIGLFSLSTPAQAQTQYIDSFTGGASESETTTAPSSGVKIILIDESGKITVADSLEALDQKNDDDATRDDMGSNLMRAQEEAIHFRKTLKQQIMALPTAINEVLYVLRASSPDGTLYAFWKTFYMSIILLFVGWLFETRVFGRRIAKRFVVSKIRENPQGYLEKLPFLVFRFAAGIVGAIISMLVAYILGISIFGASDDSAIQFTVTIIFSTYFAFRMIALVWRMVLSPYLSQYRVPSFSDRDAKRLFHWLWIGAMIGLTLEAAASWALELGLNQAVHALILVVSTIIIAFYNVLLVLVNRKAVSRAIRGCRELSEVSVYVRLASVLWAPIALIYILYSLGTLTYNSVLERDISIPLISGAYATMMTALVIYGILGYLIERMSARSRRMRRLNEDAGHFAQEDGESEEGESHAEEITPESTVKPISTYEDLAYRIAGALALLGGVWALLAIWGANLDMSQYPLFDRVGDVAAILFIGYIVYHVFRIWIDGKIAEEQPAEGEAELGDEGGAGSASRLGTLLPLFRNIILIVIFVTIGLIVLLELGINVSPLFAGAGIVGLAVGFGAQALVRDIFSGAFFLFDDAFRKGEYIDVGDVKGTVERISVRSFQLRHHLGPLHTIPFGEIKSLTNFSRDWVIMKLKLRLTYDTDVEKVRKLVKNLGQELLNDPVIGDSFLQPLKSQGVIEMQDSAMIVRVKFMTKPGDQWLARKTVYQEIRALFEREGIKFANREVTVHIADDRSDTGQPLTEQQKKSIAGAALDMDEDEGTAGAAAGGADDR